MRNDTLANGSDFSSSWKKLLWLVLTIAMTLAACVAPPPHRSHRAAPPPGPDSSVAAAAVYIYPANGQSDAQTDRDRYECNSWAIKQSGYDPSQMHADSERVNVVVGPPPGASTAAGAVTGALLGATVSRPRDAGGGAIVGAIAGAMVGATVDVDRQQRADAIQERYDRHADSVVQQAGNYRRAMTACMEGRGYTVK